MQFMFPLFNSLLLPWFTGYCLTRYLCRGLRLKAYATLAISLGLGVGTLSVSMFIIGSLGVPLFIGNINVVLYLLSFIFLYLGNKNNSSKRKDPLPSLEEANGEPDLIDKYQTAFLHIISYILIIYMAWNISLVFWKNFETPLLGWDVLATLSIKSKVIFLEESLQLIKNTPHPAYPLLIPLHESWVALNLGLWHDIWTKLFFPFFYLAYLFVHAYFLSFFVKGKWVLFGVALVSSSALFTVHASIGYRDFTLLFYNCSTIMFLILWGSKKEQAFLTLGALFAAFASFTKAEGGNYLIIYSTFLAVILMVDKQKTIKAKVIHFLRFHVIAYSVFIYYKIFKIVNNVLSESRLEFAFDFGWDKIDRFLILLRRYGDCLFVSANWSIIWFWLFITLLITIQEKRSYEVKLIGLALFIFLGVYFAYGLLTSNFVFIASEEYYRINMARLFLHFYPLGPLMLVLLYGQKQKD